MSVTAAPGFVAAGSACGVKPTGAADLALVATADRSAVPAAGVFTQNLMTAAPVVVSRAHLDATDGRAVGVVLNSGNANAATGEQGRRDAEAMCDATAEALGVQRHDVLVCSTGLIGIPLPVDLVTAAIPALAGGLGATPADGRAAADAICTTDTFAKEAIATGEGFTVGAMAKGAAMLAPNMATMLALVTTDARVDGGRLNAALRLAVDRSFNRMTTDGCTSTNDTVLVLANGLGAEPAAGAFEESLTEVCRRLAHQMVSDAEGATKSVHLEVHGARSNDEAERAARKVADSVLCKCSWYGQDPYWGRVASELGSAGVAFEAERLRVAYGGITVADQGVSVDHDADAVRAHLAGRELHLVADLGLGDGRGEVFTNDLTHAYVDENMGTS